MTDLFVRLAKYRPTAARLPKEDFFTELVAELLRREEAIREDTVRALLGDEVGAFRAEKAEIKTQQVITCSRRTELSGRLDLVLTFPDLTIIIESKVDAPINWVQLKKYLAYAEEQKRCTKVAAVSREPSEDTCGERACVLAHRLFLGSFLWSNLARVWSKQERIANPYLRDGVLEFMKEQSMGAAQPFKRDEMQAAKFWHSFDEKSKALVACLDRKLKLTHEPPTFRREPYNKPGFNGILWSSPADRVQDRGDFWYFCGFAYPPYGAWYRRPECADEPECVTFIEIWPSTDVDEFEGEVTRCLHPSLSEHFHTTRSDGGNSVILLRDRSLASFLEETDQVGQLLRFFEDSHRMLVDCDQVSRLHQLARGGSSPGSATG